jgi:molybdopterin-biosynthesis enzyme MoeA-like protein
LLRGVVKDRDAAAVAGLLTARGAIVHRITIVDDSERAIEAAVTESLDRSTNLVVTTGGLGPGLDDRTMNAVSVALRRPLAINTHAQTMVEEAYRQLHSRGVIASQATNAARQKLYSIPVGGEPVANGVGMTPGVIVRLAGGGAVLALPGAPDEARSVLENALALLKDVAPHGVVARREVETPTSDESVLHPILDILAEEYPSVSIKSEAPAADRRARIRVTLETSAPTRKEAESIVEEALRRLLDLAVGV